MDEYICNSRVLEGSKFPYIVGADRICSPNFEWLKLFGNEKMIKYLHPKSIWIPEYHYTHCLAYIIENDVKPAVFQRMFEFMEIINEITVITEPFHTYVLGGGRKLVMYSENGDTLYCSGFYNKAAYEAFYYGFRYENRRYFIRRTSKFKLAKISYA